MKNENNALKWSMLLLGVPFVLSIAAVCSKSLLIGVLSIFAMFLSLCLPVCKNRESLWTFFLTTITTIPINIFLVKAIVDFIYSEHILLYITKGICIYLVILSLEQLLFGIITRIIFRRQYKLLSDRGLYHDLYNR